MIRETVEQLRRSNSYGATGVIGGEPSRCLDDLVIEHLTMVRSIGSLSARTQGVARLMVEGYSAREIAELLGCSERSVVRSKSEFRGWMIFGGVH